MSHVPLRFDRKHGIKFYLDFVFADVSPSDSFYSKGGDSRGQLTPTVKECIRMSLFKMLL